MHDLGLLTLASKRTIAHGLMVACPMGQERDTCPARDLRKLPLRERLAVVNEMTESQLDEVIVHHRQCMKEREE